MFFCNFSGFMTKRVLRYPDLFTIVFSSTVSTIEGRNTLFFHSIFYLSLATSLHVSRIFLPFFLQKYCFGLCLPLPLLEIEYHIHFTSLFPPHVVSSTTNRYVTKKTLKLEILLLYSFMLQGCQKFKMCIIYQGILSKDTIYLRE